MSRKAIGVHEHDRGRADAVAIGRLELEARGGEVDRHDGLALALMRSPTSTTRSYSSSGRRMCRSNRRGRFW